MNSKDETNIQAMYELCNDSIEEKFIKS